MKRVMVTGATRGIGRAVVDALIVQGSEVVAVARESGRLAKLGEQRGVSSLACDLSESTQAQTLIGRVVEEVGSFDGLVNCAGILCYEMATDYSLEIMRQELAINLESPLLIAGAAIAYWRDQNVEGSIVNVSSTLSNGAAEGTSVYAASKAALNAATRGLALEAAAYQIRVNAVLPGVVDTDMAREPRLGPDEQDLSPAEFERRVAEQVEFLTSLHPLGRMGKPEEVARVIIQVLGNDWQTGSLITIDGGISVR